MSEVKDNLSSQPPGLEIVVSQTTHLISLDGIGEAKEFFAEQGCIVGADGLLKPPFTQDQLQKLKAYRESIKETSNGFEMPTERDFYRSIFLAVSLWPQIKNGQIQYLVGRGAGIEVALQGDVNNRAKNDLQFLYRSHADFDLYGVNYDVDPNGFGNIGKQPYSEEFLYVFGAQEYYPLKATKGLEHIPGKFLHETAETVDLGGIPIVIPQLEILALDKLLVPGTFSRPEGSDSLLLALQYDLNRDHILEYHERFVVEPQKGSVHDELVKGLQPYLDRLTHRQHALEIEVMKRDKISRVEARRKINDGVQTALENPKEAKDKIWEDLEAHRQAFAAFNFSKLHELERNTSTNSLITSETESIDPDLWIPLSDTDLNEAGELNHKYINQVLRKKRKLEGEEIRKQRDAKIVSFFEEVDKAKERIRARNKTIN